jgi:hypothetical protein
MDVCCYVIMFVHRVFDGFRNYELTSDPKLNKQNGNNQHDVSRH